MDDKQGLSLISEAQLLLLSAWNRLEQGSSIAESNTLPETILAAIERSINSRTKTYRYVLPTQLLAVMVNPSLDCRAIQEGCGLAGAFDARSLCHRVVVPFDRANHNVLGGSTEPYVNNPLRIPAILAKHRGPQKDKPGFKDLYTVLEHAHRTGSDVPALFQAVLAVIATRLTSTRITYPVPNRISLDDTTTLLARFLESRSGGVRLQVVAVALFKCIGETLHLYSTVRSASINAADASTGQIADIECLAEDEHVVLAVEVKDRQLTLRHVEDKLPSVRERGIRELLFLIKGGILGADEDKVEALINQQFVTGQNVYVCEFDVLLKVCLVLFGETGRRRLLQQLGEELDTMRVDLAHREAWRDLLQGV
jgi:hypothetical protein